MQKGESTLRLRADTLSIRQAQQSEKMFSILRV
nr:MAG TPA: hypothetical protein [Caudoviricetes sp.]